MNLIIRNARIIDPGQPLHNKVTDLKISRGIIERIAEKVENPDRYDELQLENLHVSAGWFDSSVSFGEPGFEDRETISNGLETAAKSGFTSVALQPNTSPVTDSQSQVSFLKNKANNTAVDIFPIGALTKKSEGNDLAELFDMKKAGAVAFGDYNKNMQNPNLLKIALQYAADFDALVIAYSHDSDIVANGVVNEGAVSTRLGLKGIPALAEELAIARNLFILKYTGGKLHLPTVSTMGSVKLIRDAKSEGLNVTCSVSVHHLVLTDEELEGFDTRYKVTPPLRTEIDRQALIDAVKDGTIDMITSDHNPIDIENKKIEFDGAKHGTIGLESAFGALLSVLPLDIVIEKLTSGRKIFGTNKQIISEGNAAGLTFFNPDVAYTFSKADILSRSKNSAFIGKEMVGKAYGVYNNGILALRK
ncbi:MAG TPA: dihydroorotase [Flavobacterium sp.]